MVRRGIALVLLAQLAGCSTPANGGRSERHLTVAIPRDVGPINPYIGATDAMVGLVYDKLVEPSPHVIEQHLGLAESVTQIDSMTWTVTVRDGIAWHDGAPFTAEDVVFTYNYYRDGPPTRHAHHVSAVPRIDSIVATDAHTVRFVCGYPCPTLARVTFADLPILPKHIWKDVTEPRKLTTLPIGTGPFRLVEYRPDQLYRFVANATYYGGTPTVDTLDMPVIADQSSMFVALKTGQVDAVGKKVPPELLATFQALPDVSVVRTAGLGISELRTNYERPPFDGTGMRHALSLAIDREAIVATVLLGHGRPGFRGYPHPDSPWTDSTLHTPYDVERAATVFDAEGFRDRNGDGVREWPDGRPVQFVLVLAAGEPALERTAELIARQLTAQGLPTQVVVMEQAAASARVSARDFDLYLAETGSHATSDPDQFVMSQRTGYLWSDKLPYPELDSAIAHWMATTTIDTRTHAAYAIQQLFNRQPTSIGVYYPDEYYAYRKGGFGGWTESRGYGIVHKWSFLPPMTGTALTVLSASPSPK